MSGFCSKGVLSHLERFCPLEGFCPTPPQSGVRVRPSLSFNFSSNGCPLSWAIILFRDLARNEEFSEIAVINIFYSSQNKNTVMLGGGGPAGENFEISHAIDM